MKNITKRITLFGSLALFAAIAISFSAVTFAKYVEGKKTEQSAFGLGGEREVSIFFNANIWKQGKDSSGNIVDASYYLYVWYHNDGTGADSKQDILAPSAHITPTISGVVMDLYVYEFDTTTLNRMIFIRWNPEIAPSTDISHGDGKGNWNQTDNITYSSTYNYYCIDSWGSGSPAQATPNKNRIDKNPSTGALTWGNPS